MIFAATALGILCSALGHGLLWTAAVNRLHALGWPRKFVKRLTAVLVLAFAALPAVAARQGAFAATHGLPFASAKWFGPYAWLTLAVGVVVAPLRIARQGRRYDPSIVGPASSETRDVAGRLGRRPLAGGYARLLDALPGNESLDVSIERRKLTLARLPHELVGLTIAHLSDLHMTGRYDRGFYDEIVRETNDQRPDVILVTGDVVESETCVEWLPETLGQLCAPLGAYFILGNHDLIIDAAATRRTLVDCGLIDLGGRWLRADWNGASVALCGNELPWFSPAPDLDAAPPRRPGEAALRIALCHSPDQFGWAVRADVDLALAGHTHGGQFQAPLLGPINCPSLYGTRYACGAFRRGATVLYVSRGLAAATPFRWRCPPELAVLQLAREI